jgi:hypothetical protein
LDSPEDDDNLDDMSTESDDERSLSDERLTSMNAIPSLRRERARGICACLGRSIAFHIVATSIKTSKTRGAAQAETTRGVGTPSRQDLATELHEILAMRLFVS